jgi:hypothetical protein
MSAADAIVPGLAFRGLRRRGVAGVVEGLSGIAVFFIAMVQSTHTPSL